MAEAIFQDRVNRAGLSESFLIDSAGTGPWHVGQHAHPGTLDLLRRSAIPYDGRARQVTPSDFSQFDYIVAMDSDHLNTLSRLNRNNRAKIFRFLDVARQKGLTTFKDVPDPYYDDSFERVFDLVSVGADALLAFIRAENGI